MTGRTMPNSVRPLCFASISSFYFFTACLIVLLSLHVHMLLQTVNKTTTRSVESNQIYSSHTQYTKAKYTVYSKCGATRSSQRANAPLMGHPVTETVRTELNVE